MINQKNGPSLKELLASVPAQYQTRASKLKWLAEQGKLKNPERLMRAPKAAIRTELDNIASLHDQYVLKHKRAPNYKDAEGEQSFQHVINSRPHGRGEVTALATYIGKKQLTSNDPKWPKLPLKGKLREARIMALDDYEPGTVATANRPLLGYGLNDVNTRYLQSVLAPEFNAVRRPNNIPQQTAIGRTVFTIPLVTNASGAVGFHICPKAFNQGSFAQSYNGIGFNPVTGSNGLGSPISSDGPFYPSRDSMDSAVVLNMAVCVRPIVSAINSSGLVQMAYYQAPPNGSFTVVGAVPVLTQAQMQALPFYSQTSLDKSSPLRMIRLPLATDPITLSGDESTSWQDGFYVLVTGAPASVTIAQVQITIGIEFTPVSTYLPICHMDIPDPGQATQACLSNIIAMRPHVQQLSVDSILELFRSIPERFALHDDVTAAFSRLPHVATRVLQYTPMVQDDASVRSMDEF